MKLCWVLSDEVNARDAGYYIAIDLGGNYDKKVKRFWQNPIQSKSNKIQHLKNSNAYGRYPTGPINNTNTVKVKTSTQYMLPYRRRE